MLNDVGCWQGYLAAPQSLGLMACRECAALSSQRVRDSKTQTDSVGHEVGLLGQVCEGPARSSITSIL